MIKSEFKELVKSVIDADFKDIQIKGMSYNDGFFFDGNLLKDKRYYVVILSGIGINEKGITSHFDCSKWIKRIRIKNENFTTAQKEFAKYSRWLKEVL